MARNHVVSQTENRALRPSAKLTVERRPFFPTDPRSFRFVKLLELRGFRQGQLALNASVDLLENLQRLIESPIRVVGERILRISEGLARFLRFEFPAKLRCFFDDPIQIERVRREFFDGDDES